MIYPKVIPVRSDGRGELIHLQDTLGDEEYLNHIWRERDPEASTAKPLWNWPAGKAMAANVYHIRTVAK